MQFETFRGRNVEEALAAVRAALGPDAFIESTRHVSNGEKGWLGKSFVEVLAAPADRPSSAREPRACACACACGAGLLSDSRVRAGLETGAEECARRSAVWRENGLARAAEGRSEGAARTSTNDFPSHPFSPFDT